MPVRFYKPYTPGTRGKTVIYIDRSDRPEKKITPNTNLTITKKPCTGRNSRGIITVQGKCGGHKKRLRSIDFHRKQSTLSNVLHVEYDPNRSANIALVKNRNGQENYILHTHGVKKGNKVQSGSGYSFYHSFLSLAYGRSIQLKYIPLRTKVHNVELISGRGGQISRAAGTSAEIIAHKGNFVTLKLPSREVRVVRKECYATVGEVANGEYKNLVIGKAGRNRWFGKRPKVRGLAKNPNDHPHGGGEGRCGIGRTPSTPWGKPTLGPRTRKKNKYSNRYITSRRTRKKKIDNYE
uniref:Large ribosomal subunit protein uL2c n=1 Tax=Karlodinium veneficum TaxID=407301 RepID=G1E785_KARVE|nr:ribosomal protein L2 [Karlodinium veneficum]